MPNRIEDDFGEAARHLRVDTLVMLRWSAIIGQTFALIYVYHYLKFDFPIGLCFVAVATSTALNIALRAGTPRSFRLDDSEAAVLLAFDILELAALLYLTGGVVNSFAMLFLAPVMISAVSLPRKLTLLLGILMVAAATLLTVEYLPLPWRTGEPLQFPLLYRLGVWSALVLSAAFVGLYAARVSDEARQLAGALSATELVLERAQHLTQLDGLAAAAAHELGTPLSTISVIAKELENAIAADAPHGDDVRLLREQATRCRDILAKITELSSSGEPFDRTPLSALIEEVVAPHRNFGVAIDVTAPGNREAEPVGARNPAILYGLGNLVENAVDFARGRVEIGAQWSADAIDVTISDDGPGFAPDILDRIGEPYVTTRKRNPNEDSDEATGLGLGFFIAKTLLERSGATLNFENREFPHRGAVIKLRWRRGEFERSIGFLTP